MDLEFHAPDAEEDLIMVLPPQEVIEEGAKEWERCLVGYLMDAKLSVAVVSTIARKIWSRFGLTDISAQGNGIFFFKFSLEEGKEQVLEGGPRLFIGRHMLLRKWERGIQPSNEKVTKIPV